MRYFSHYRNGMEILKQVLTQLLLYYTRFQVRPCAASAHVTCRLTRLCLSRVLTWWSEHHQAGVLAAAAVGEGARVRAHHHVRDSQVQPHHRVMRRLAHCGTIHCWRVHCQHALPVRVTPQMRASVQERDGRA